MKNKKREGGDKKKIVMSRKGNKKTFNNLRSQLF